MNNINSTHYISQDSSFEHRLVFRVLLGIEEIWRRSSRAPRGERDWCGDGKQRLGEQ